ncbi:MAG: PAS domain S-box protein [Deltaproteobacteria bacterium]|nr:PAS domain S-box protein [Deltaproteobacteria bacterium]
MARMCVDETEIKNANIFEILLDNFPDMIHSVDGKGQIVYANRTAEALLGYTREELLTMNIREVYAESVLEAVDKGFLDLKERGDKTIPESLVKAKDGTAIAVEIRSFSIYDDNNRFVRTFSILRDLREQKKLQRQLIHAGRLAAIGELASGVAHDINNPLTVITLANEMALTELKNGDKISSKTLNIIKSQMENVERASNSIKKLVDHLQNFSRSTTEDYEIFDLYHTLDDALFIVGSKIKKLDINIYNKVNENRYFVKGSQNNMEQVFVNLLSNSCDAMAGQADERKIELSISPCRRSNVDCWKCAVSDTGTGFPEDMTEDIFQSFFTTKQKGKGTGLGLSIVRGIVRDHNGDIEATGGETNGAIFSVYIPQADIQGD